MGEENIVSDGQDDNTPRGQAFDRRRLLRPSSNEAAARLKSAAASRLGVRPARDEPEAGPRAKTPGRSDYLAVKAILHERLLDEIGERRLLDSEGADLTAAVQEFAERVIASENVALNEAERVRLAEELTDETIGMGPLAPLLADPAVSDILVNRPDQVYVERFGRLELTDIRFRDADHVVRVIERIAARVGRRIDTAWPMADLRLPDGSRVNATLPPVTLDSPTLSIRRFGRQRLRRDDLLANGTLSPEMMEFLVLAVRSRKNILISGGTGAGKSTLLGALAEAIPETERIITIEDTAELILDQEHLVRMESRPANIEGRGRILARDLVTNALRMRPDRIIVGEVRGGEALDMLQALNTGHDGGLCTVHANSSRDALARLETMVLMAGMELPSRAIREQIVSAIHFVVHVRRFDDGVRRIEARGRDYGPGGRDAPDAGHLRVPPARAAGAAHRRPLQRDGRRAPHGRRTARAGCPGARDVVPAIRGVPVVRGAALILMVAGAIAAFRLLYARRAQRRAAERLGRVLADQHEPQRRDDSHVRFFRPFPPRYGFVGPLLAALVTAGLWGGASVPLGVAAAVGTLAGVMAYLIEDYVAERRAATIEVQLAAAIDLLIGSLRAGASLLAAFESALEEADAPIRPYLQEVAGRIRLGDDPRGAVGDLQVRVPLETFKLFATSLAVHWEVGGSLATTLTMIGATVRDRVELSRRVRAQGVEANASVAVILVIAYVLGFLMWRSNPDRLEAFVMTGVGTTLVAAAIFLQAIGLVWMSRLSRSRF